MSDKTLIELVAKSVLPTDVFNTREPQIQFLDKELAENGSAEQFLHQEKYFGLLIEFSRHKGQVHFYLSVEVVAECRAFVEMKWPNWEADMKRSGAQQLYVTQMAV